MLSALSPHHLSKVEKKGQEYNCHQALFLPVVGVRLGRGGKAISLPTVAPIPSQWMKFAQDGLFCGRKRARKGNEVSCLPSSSPLPCPAPFPGMRACKVMPALLEEGGFNVLFA